MTTEPVHESLTIDQFISRHGITLEAVKVPLIETWEGDKNAQSWRYTLKCGGRKMSGTFTKGSAHRVWRRGWSGEYDRPKGAIPGRRAQLPWSPSKYDRNAYLAWSEPEPPTVSEVLDSLAVDVSSIDQPFEDWAQEYGFDTDSRKAEHMYEACRKEYYELRRLLGVRDLETLLNDVERL